MQAVGHFQPPQHTNESQYVSLAPGRCLCAHPYLSTAPPVSTSLLNSLPLALLPQVMSDIVKVGAAIETSLGSAQDVEGVVDHEGYVYIVQTRPQV